MRDPIQPILDNLNKGYFNKALNTFKNMLKLTHIDFASGVSLEQDGDLGYPQKGGARVFWTNNLPSNESGYVQLTRCAPSFDSVIK